MEHLNIFVHHNTTMANSKHLVSVMLIAFFLLLLNKVNSSDTVSFSFPKFEEGMKGITFRGDAHASSGSTIQLTRTGSDGKPLLNSGGQALYAEPMHLWDSKTGRLASFYTTFSFLIKTTSYYADGITFFMVPVESDKYQNGGMLTLFNADTAMTPSSNKVFAVEFDTYSNGWDPSYPHIGVNVNTVQSVATLKWDNIDVVSGSVANVQITYNSDTKRLCVLLSYPNSKGTGFYTLSNALDLKTVLPEQVKFGLSGSTGSGTETHDILSWSFSSTLDLESSSGNKMGNEFYDACATM